MKPVAFTAQSIAQMKAEMDQYCNKGSKYSLGIVFGSYVFDMDEVRSIFKEHHLDVFGASSAGEIAHGKINEKSISVMLLDVNPAHYKVKVFNSSGKISFQSGKEAGTWARESFDKPGLLVLVAGGKGHMDGDQVVNGIKEGGGTNITAFGGFAGNDLHPEKDTFVFDTEGTITDGIATLTMDQDIIKINGLTHCGWKPIGTPKIITKSSGNIVYEIDGKPALDVYQKYFRVVSQLDIAQSYEMGSQIEREDGSSVSRAGYIFNENKSITYTGSIPEGTRIRFCISPGFELIDDTITHLKEFNDRFPEADAAISFYCVSRLGVFGPMAENETQTVSDCWKVPQTGFLTFGEIGPGSNGICDFHNYILSLALLKEKLNRQ